MPKKRDAEETKMMRTSATQQLTPNTKAKRNTLSTPVGRTSAAELEAARAQHR